MISNCLDWAAFSVSDATVHDIGEDTGDYKIGMDIDESKFIHFRLDELKAATNDMSNENKLGQGGYGSIYKVCIYASNFIC